MLKDIRNPKLVEIPALKESSNNKKQEVHPCVNEYKVGNKRLYLLTEERLVNLCSWEIGT